MGKQFNFTPNESLAMMMNNFTKSTCNWKQLLLDQKVQKYISHLTGCSFKSFHRKCLTLYRKISFWETREGIVSVCKRLKESHKHYLLTNSMKFFKRKYFFGKGISDLGGKILMTIHRSMYGPIDFSVETIKYPRTNPGRFFKKYHHAFEAIHKSGLLKFPSELLGDWKVTHRHQGLKRQANPYLGNLRNEITVDSNNRTGGLEYPLRVTLSGSANGSTLDSQIKDLEILLRPENKKMLSDILLLNKYFGKNLVIPQVQPSSNPELCLSRLHALRDKSCKTRVIAIADTFTQISLRPIHYLLDKVTARILNDYTRSHANGVKYLCSLNCKLYSFDITSATDTIPRELGFWALKSVLKKGVSDTVHPWHINRIQREVERLMVDRDFRIGDSQNTVRYTVGQPMGFYASFPMLALSQHVLVHLAGFLIYHKIKYLPYAVVGDDICIGDELVALKYQELCNELSIPINKKKSVIGYRTGEFCSRIFVDGHIKSTPTMRSFFTSYHGKDPIPLLKIYDEYNIEKPRYDILSQYFSRRSLRTGLSFSGLVVPGMPKLVVIPASVKTHAERVFICTQKCLQREKRKVVSDNPYLLRLNYGRDIHNLVGDKLKKLLKKQSPWVAIHTITANTFYLGYLDTYFERKRLRYEAFRSFSKERVTRSEKIRHICMTYRNQWSVIDPLLK